MRGDPYVILGVPRDASPDAIRRAWRQKAFALHPDRGGDARAFVQASDAWAILSDPATRARLDVWDPPDPPGPATTRPEDAFGLSVRPQSRRGDAPPRVDPHHAARLRAALARYAEEQVWLEDLCGDLGHWTRDGVLRDGRVPVRRRRRS